MDYIFLESELRNRTDSIMTKEMKNALNSLVKYYIQELRSQIPKRWNSLIIDLAKKEVYEVLFGQLARQVTLCLQFVKNPNCWTFDLAPVILRCMADNYINFAWIAKDVDDRSKKFILYGLGQEKLSFEHRKDQIIKDGGDPNKDPLVKYNEAWLNSQRYTFLTEVNIGSWSGISIRQMAEEADCIDFYNYVYTPFSSVAHNMWGHLTRYNLVVSDNPLHKNLKIPVINESFIDIYNIKLAAMYLDKMIRLFDGVFKIKLDEKSAYDKLLSEFKKFENQFLKNNG